MSTWKRHVPICCACFAEVSDQIEDSDSEFENRPPPAPALPPGAPAQPAQAVARAVPVFARRPAGTAHGGGASGAAQAPGEEDELCEPADAAEGCQADEAGATGMSSDKVCANALFLEAA